MYKERLVIRRDLTNKRFGMLKVICPYKKHSHGTLWKCLCDCGKFTNVLSFHLASGHTKSCGCLAKKTQFKKENLYNKKFNRLTAIKSIGKIKSSNSYTWRCLCDCGNYKNVGISDLKSGKVKSCGCLIKSKESKERRRKTYLRKYGVEWLTQNKEIRLKAAKSANQITELRHWFSSENILCQGSWEVKVVEYFNKNKIDYNWQVQTFLMPAGRTYTPDCYLPDEDKWIEIKGMWYNSKEKWDWFRKENSNSELWNEKKLKELGIL